MSKKSKETTEKSVTKSDLRSRNQLVAQRRGDDWRKKVIMSKLCPNCSDLAKIRAERGLSQNYLFGLSGLGSVGTYSRLERRQALIGKAGANAIAKALRVRVSKLFESVGDSLYAVK